MNKKIVFSTLLVAGIIAAIVGCGTASNDQGTSFTLLGFGNLTEDATTSAITCSSTSFTNNIDVALSNLTQGNGVISACPVMQNNLTGMTVRTERINLSYYIPGATEQPPSTTTAGTIVLGASGTSSSTTTTTNAIPSKATLNINAVPQAVRTWLSLNRSKLPKAPFSMDITVSVSGVTGSGDLIESNQALLQANVTSDLPVTGTGGSGGSSGSTTQTPAATATKTG